LALTIFQSSLLFGLLPRTTGFPLFDGSGSQGAALPFLDAVFDLAIRVFRIRRAVVRPSQGRMHLSPPSILPFKPFSPLAYAATVVGGPGPGLPTRPRFSLRNWFFCASRPLLGDCGPPTPSCPMCGYRSNCREHSSRPGQHHFFSQSFLELTLEGKLPFFLC